MNAYAQKEQKASSEKDKTGIPAQMKAKFERSSGFSFDDVRVHYNSEKPAQLHAHAYTQGSEVFVAPGQEKHLPHELGHVVQQKSSAVKPTGEIGGMPLNDDETMESGADKLAEEAESSEEPDKEPLQAKAKDGGVVQREEASEGSYNYYAGKMSGISSAISTAFGIAGGIGALVSFGYSKYTTRKHRYIDEIEKYADAACDAREEQIAAKEMYDNTADAEQQKAKSEIMKLGAKIKRNYKAAVDKTHAMKKTLTWDSVKGIRPDESQNARNARHGNLISDENVRNAINRADEAYFESEKALTSIQQHQIQPHEQQPHEQPAHEQPAHEQPPHEQPPHEQPPHEQPPHEQPPHEQPPHEQQPHEQQPHEQQPHEQPPHEQQPHEQPPHEQPPHEQPPHEQPPHELVPPNDERVQNNDQP